MIPTAPSTYRIELAEHRALSIRLHCAPAPIHQAPQIIAEPCLHEQATRFVSYEAAAIVHARYFPRTAVEIVRVDA